MNSVAQILGFAYKPQASSSLNSLLKLNWMKAPCQNLYTMNRKLLLIVAIVLAFNFTACKPTIDYLGNAYAPTSNVEISFDPQDIQRSYKIMGKMENSGNPGELDRAQAVQAVMLEKAKSVGADAILFSGLPREKWLSDSSETSVEKDENKKTVTKTNRVNTVKIYEANLLKYTD